LEQTLRVEPEGHRIDRNVPLIVDLSVQEAETTPFKHSIQMQFPAQNEVVPGSRRGRVDLIGDIMGPVLANLGSLIRMPYGCGEQNMVTVSAGMKT
jgi:CD109 antigen